MNYIVAILLVLVLISCEEKKSISEYVIKKGVHLIDNEEYHKAIAYFNSLSTDDIDDFSKAVLFRNISISYQNLGMLDSAKFFAKKSYLNAPDESFEYYLNKADYNLLVNHVTEAIQNLNKAKEIDAKRQELYNRYCSVYSGEYGEVFFDPELAEKNAILACKIKPNRIVKEQLGAIYFQNEKYSQSAKIFKELIRLYPENKKYTFYLGQAMYFNGNENTGVELMRDAADRDDSCKVMFNEIFQNN